MAKRSKQRAPAVPRNRFSLTQGELGYARLLADPCNAPLVHGPFGDGSGGMISRFESDFIYGYSSTDVNGSLAFLPSGPSCYENVTLTDTTTFAYNAGVFAPPGSAFLQANCSSYRCLAACIQVYWPGTELNRQGIISVGCLPAEAVFNTDNTVSKLRTLSQYVERTPAGMAEIKWQPTSFDTQFTDAGDAASSGSGVDSKLSTSRRNALVVTHAGLPANVGMRVRIVAVYEWKPRVGSGFVTASSASPAGTVANTLRYLESTGDWMYRGAMAAQRTISSMAAGVGAIASTVNGARRLGVALLA